MCVGQIVATAARRSAACAARSRTTPSWSSTGTPSAVSQTSLSSPVAPRRRPSANASMRVLRGRGPGRRGGRTRSAGRAATGAVVAPRPMMAGLVDCARVFNLSGSEIVVILLLALVVLGPEKLPDALRRAGRTYAELKKMGNSFQTEVQERARRADAGDARDRRPAAQVRLDVTGEPGAEVGRAGAAPSRPRRRPTDVAADRSDGVPPTSRRRRTSRRQRPTSDADQPHAQRRDAADRPRRTDADDEPPTT